MQLENTGIVSIMPPLAISYIAQKKKQIAVREDKL